MDLDALVVMALVEITETVAAQGGRSALGTVDLDVLAAVWVAGHGDSFLALSCQLSAISRSGGKVAR
jgi:hypothetical protein